MKLVAVTFCPTGIAHSQTATENVEQTAQELGHEITVEDAAQHQRRRYKSPPTDRPV